MIVSCPSCHQRYRHDFDVHKVGVDAHCTACDEHFELALPKRQYMVVEAGSPPQAVRMPVIQEDVPPPAATATNVEIDLPVAETPSVFDLPEDEERAVAAGADGASLDGAVDGTSAAAVPEQDSASSVGSRATLSGALLEGLVALVPCGVGAGMAYHFAGPMGQDPITWAALGGAIGLLLGWACLLWITHGD